MSRQPWSAQAVRLIPRLELDLEKVLRGEENGIFFYQRKDQEIFFFLFFNGRLHVQSSSPAFALISEMQIQFQSSNWKFPVTALLTNTLQKKTLFFILLFYFPLYQLNSFNS